MAAGNGLESPRLLRRLRKLVPDAMTCEEGLQAICAQLITPSCKVPIDLHEIGAGLRVKKIEAAENLQAHGQLYREKGSFVIRYRSDLNAGRVRFTVAHELGHALLEKTGARPPRNGADVERFCDRFASLVLMPSDLFTRFVSNPPSVANLRKLASLFQTSLQATALRYHEIAGVEAIFRSESATWATGGIRINDPAIREAESTALRDGSAVLTISRNANERRIRRLDTERLGDGYIGVFVPL